ncbi:glyoxalase-like protein [Tamaricihabitans halophyticus]|uniref:Glyoxalase-like protein n=1 Tax=Tamaricihabitans halophyticus TaxID=1262583 RepID=A0A4R2RBU6_9PSEU|nr:VOC family protein [Tamaricihabitans halophyticus]TCP56895.1 glyoxalase-like protein [Tamaricihabitans halophyticus]
MDQPNNLGLTGIDHLMIRVAELDRAARMFARLGFTVAPPRRQIDPAALATAAGANPATTPAPLIDNRLILFTPPADSPGANYLELMSIVDPLRMPPAVTQMLSFLLDSEGPKSIVCHTNDLDHCREAMLAAGVEIGGPVEINTGWLDPDSSELIPVRARPAAPVFGQIPFQINPYETDTLSSYQHPRWTAHPNGARHLLGLTGVTHDLAAHASYMATDVFGVDVDWRGQHEALMWFGGVFLRVVTPDGFAQRYPTLDYSRERVPPFVTAATIAVGDLDVTRRFLRTNQIRHAVTATGIGVPREYAANTLLEFVPDSP